MLHILSRTHPISLNTFLILHPNSTADPSHTAAPATALLITVTFPFLIRGVRYAYRGLAKNNEDSHLSKMFLLNTKLISHFCLMALAIAVQGNGFLSNVFLMVLARNPWQPGLTWRAGRLQGIRLTWGDHNPGPHSKMQFPPVASCHTVTNTSTKRLPRQDSC